MTTLENTPRRGGRAGIGRATAVVLHTTPVPVSSFSISPVQYT